MWTCQNCGYSEEAGDSFEEELDDDGEVLRYCPECGSDEVVRGDDEDENEEELYVEEPDDLKYGRGSDRDEE